ncbi:MAG: glycosyltransferase [Lachnospiraceae bacterium]|nr:glycosyltransferase [Lachnospiraceae bacterium]
MKKISVVMPVYNGEEYLREAINSILNQTFTDFEFIIVNDGSTDGSEDIIKSYNDSRIVYLKNDKNKGIVYSLNRGLDEVKGKYIARMDCDDISLPYRFQKQYDYMEKHPNVAVCGTNIEFIGSKSGVFGAVVNSAWLKASMFFSSVLAHPTVMMRTAVIHGENLHYDPIFEKVEDFELWTRISDKHEINNLEEILFRYRIHPKQITQNYSYVEENSFRKLKRRELEKLKFEYSEAEFDSFVKYCFRFTDLIYTDICRINSFCEKAYEANRKEKVYVQAALGKVMSDCITCACSEVELTEEQKMTIYRESIFAKKWFRYYVLAARKIAVFTNRLIE